MEIQELKNKKELMCKEIKESIERFSETTGIHPLSVDVIIRSNDYSVGERRRYVHSVHALLDI